MEPVRKITVLGGTGFIGSHMVKFLKDKGHWVRAVDKEVQSRIKSRGVLFGVADEILKLDLRKLDNCILAIKDCDYVIHLASDMGGVGYFTYNDYYPYINNMRMDMNVLEACEILGTKRLFYSSSACIYPTHKQQNTKNVPKLKEYQIYPANSDLSYGWEKLMMLRLCERSPLDARVGIFHTIFGEYQEIEGPRMKFPPSIAVKALKARKTGKIEVWGDGTQVRSFLYIKDALEKIYAVLMYSRYTIPINIGSDEAVSVNQVIDMVCQIVGIKPEIIYNEDMPSGVLARNCDNTLFESIYSIKNNYSTYQGFENLINWLETQDGFAGIN